MEHENYGTIWVCSCCMFTAANGECCANEQHGGDGEQPLSGLSDGERITLGMGWEDHEDDCLTHVIRDLQERFPDVDWPDVPDGYECDCEEKTYSTSQCEGCGSYLHGKRYAATLWHPAGVV